MTDAQSEALFIIARQDAKGLLSLADEVHEEANRDSPDPDLILPLCKELQARSQAVFNRVAEAAGEGRNNAG